MIEVTFEDAVLAIRSIWKIESGRGKRSMRLGWFGARLKEKDEFQKHGFADEAAFRDSIGISVKTWGRYVRIAGFFPNLDVERFSLMSAENAEQLGSLPDEYRYKPQWLEDAGKLKAEEFRKKVLEAKSEVYGVPVKEMRVRWNVSLFEQQRTVIKEALAEFMKDNSISDEGTALEWMVIEASSRQTFTRFLRQQIPLLRKHMEGGDPQAALTVHLAEMRKLLDNLKGESA